MRHLIDIVKFMKSETVDEDIIDVEDAQDTHDSWDGDLELDEEAPPGEKAKHFLKKAKNDFKKRYGKEWKSALYATAWKMFG